VSKRHSSDRIAKLHKGINRTYAVRRIANISAILTRSARDLAPIFRVNQPLHREKEVMALVTGGLLNKQVAAELGVSEITVKVHRGNGQRANPVSTN
jgi:FixJ family two-component response regulator